jgi:CBS domain-containing protein
MSNTRARDVMTPDPVCCAPHMTLDEVARLMLQFDCGEIPVIDASDHLVGVVTDRDIVCRVVAAGKNPMGYSVQECMTPSVVTVSVDDPLEHVVEVMAKHEIRRVPVVDERGSCAGIIAQADLAQFADARAVGELVRKVSDEPDTK